MASKAEIINLLEGLEAVYPFRVVRSAEQYAQWLAAYIEDLKQYTAEALGMACAEWRRSDAKKFPLIGELLRLVRKYAVPPTSVRYVAWKPAGEVEYAGMTIREKIREEKLLGQLKRTNAGPMWRDGQPIAAEDMPPRWHTLCAESQDHYAEARRLENILKQHQGDAA